MKSTRVRYGILAAVFINVVINYMDRLNLSIAADYLGDELGLGKVELGYLFSAFGLTYSFCQIPGGILADRFGNRGFYSLCLIMWSLATVIQGVAGGFLMIFVMRILVGFFEAPSYPLNNRIVTRWFPEQERAGAIGIYTSGQFLGSAFLAFALIMIVGAFGWRMLFFITGGIGIVWGIIWYFIYRDPGEHPRVSESELSLIEEGGGLGAEKAGPAGGQDGFRWSDLALVLSRRKLWGIYLGQFGLGATQIFFLTWFPTYLKEEKGLDLKQAGFAASIPFVFAFFGVLLSGFLSDFLVRKKVDAGLARKVPMVTGLLLSTSIIGANYVSSTVGVTVFMSLAFFGSGLASIAWVFVSLLAPKHLLGLTGGVFNFIGGLSAIVVPTVIGFLAKDGSFAPALIFISALTLMAAASYVFLVGKLERIEVPGE
ncbi:MAG: MFS transporter [Verrucomicrobiota bacterium]